MALTQLSIAQQILKLTGHLLPCVIIPRPDGSYVYVSLPPDRQLWKMFLTSLLRSERAVCYFVLCEAWACQVQQGGPDSAEEVPGLLVSENPLSYEIILVAVIERTGDLVLVHQQFTHELQSIKLFRPRVFMNRVKLPTLPTHWSSRERG